STGCPPRPLLVGITKLAPFFHSLIKIWTTPAGTAGWSDGVITTALADSGIARRPPAMDTPITLAGSGLVAKMTRESIRCCFSSSASAPWPRTTITVSIPPARRYSMQDSITVLAPKGRRGLNAPMRWERPAARTMAATSLVFGLGFLVFAIRLGLWPVTLKDQRPKSKVQRPKR